MIGWKVTEQYAFARDLALIDLPNSFSPTSISIKPICLHKNSRKSELSIMEKASLGLQYNDNFLFPALTQDELKLKQFIFLGKTKYMY